MNKFQFIKELLDTKKFNPQQKERFFKLVSSELANVGDRDQKIHEDILLIKEKIGLKDEKLPIKGRLAALKEETKRKKTLENGADGERKKFGSAKDFTSLMSENDLQQQDDKEIKKTGFIIDTDGAQVEVDVPDNFALFDVKALIGEEAYNEMMENKDADDLKSKKKKIESNMPVEEMSEGLKALLASGTKPLGQTVELNNNEKVNPLLVGFTPPDIRAKSKTKTGMEILLEAGSASILKVKENRSTKIELSKYINPIGLSEFLLAYNQDPILKYTCHPIDDIAIVTRFLDEYDIKEYDIKVHQEKINDAFVALLKHHKINTKIWSLINSYLNGNTAWSSDKITINWKSAEILKWCQENKNIVPHPGLNLSNLYKSRGYEFTSFKSKITGQRIKSFAQLVIHFKNLFHLRADNSLKNLIEYRNEDKWNDRVDFEIDSTTFWTNLELFTDVDKLLQAYDNIMTIIVTTANEFNLPKPNVKIIFMEEGSNIKLSIHHKNTVFKKTGDNLVKRVGEAHTELINNLVNGLCDLYLNADFDNKQYGQINLWNEKPRSLTPIEKFVGVEHILLFKQ